MRRALGVLLILVGSLLLYWAYDGAQALRAGMSYSELGLSPESLWQYAVTGVVAWIFGGLILWRMWRS